MRTDDEINTQIEFLKGIKDKVMKYTFFGENNHAAIAAEIEVLEKGRGQDPAQGEDWVWQQYGENEDCRHERDHALEATRWLDGDDSCAPNHPNRWPSVKQVK